MTDTITLPRFIVEQANAALIRITNSAGFQYMLAEAREEVEASIATIRAALEAKVEQETVEFLCDGTRYKVSSLDGSCGIFCLPEDLAGRWVALVAAEDDCHMKLSDPSADAVDAARYRFRKSFLERGGAVFFVAGRYVQYRMNGELISQGETEEQAIDAAMKKEKSDE